MYPCQYCLKRLNTSFLGVNIEVVTFLAGYEVAYDTHHYVVCTYLDEDGSFLALYDVPGFTWVRNCVLDVCLVLPFLPTP
jgi:hypothetical protein